MPITSPGWADGQDVGSRSNPALADLDGDGDLDIVAGTDAGFLAYRSNTGSADSPAFAPAANPLGAVDVGVRAAPAIGDFDGDGDLDVVSGTGTGAFAYFENTGSATNPLFAARTGNANPLNGQDIGTNSRSALGDLDGDGDLDLVGADDNAAVFAYYENTGTAKIPAFIARTGAANPLDGLGVSAGAPALGDLDGDGDLDVVAGVQLGGFATFENIGTAKSPAFVARTGSANPLNGLDAGTFSSPALGDLDGDADPDLVAGNYDGIFLSYANGRGTFVPRTGAANPFDGHDVGIGATPTLGDLDGDGDLDLMSGVADLSNRGFRYFANTGTGTDPAFAPRTGTANPLNGQDIGPGTRPALGDLDGDGDLDVVAGEQQGTFAYFENTGSATSPVFVQRTGAANPLNAMSLQAPLAQSAPSIGDVDGDGDADVVSGSNSGDFVYFENTGSPGIPAFSPAFPLALLDEGGASSTPSLGDFDGDGDSDFVAGRSDGRFGYFENARIGTDPFVSRAGAANPVAHWDAGVESAPALGDLDADGDLDFVTGRSDGTFAYFERIRPLSVPVRELTGAANPLAGQDVGALAAPALADLDGDGDADLVVGEELGTFRYFANTGHALVPVFTLLTGSANPLNGRDTGDRATPALGDLDGDGDFDLLSGRSAGDYDYFANTGTALAPAFASAVANPFGLSGLGSDSAPVLGDFDHDGDLDLAAGQYYGGLAYFENTGSATNPGFAARTGVANPFHELTDAYYTAPTAGDFDRDGDLDLISGGAFGRWTWFYNAGGVSPDPERRTGVLNPLDGADLGSRSMPAAGDLNGDGTPDLVTGSLAGTFTVHYFPEPARGLLLAAGTVLVSLLCRRRR